MLMNKSKNNNNIPRSNLYKKLIFVIIIFTILFFIMTSGKFIIPQIMQIFKIGIPILTKLIGL